MQTHTWVSEDPIDDHTNLISTDEAARMLGISAVRVRHHVRNGRLPATRTSGQRGNSRGNYRYRRADVEAFAAIPRRVGVPITAEGRWARKHNFNYFGGNTSRLSGRSRFHPVRRRLPPKLRRLFDVAILAAAKQAGGRTPRQRRLRRSRAIFTVIAATVRAWNAPARTKPEQQLNLINALKPWLDHVAIDDHGEPVFDRSP